MSTWKLPAWSPKPLLWGVLTVANLVFTVLWGDDLADWLVVVALGYITLLELRIQRLEREAGERPLWPV